MSWDKVKEVLADVAPSLGAVLGGPVGAAAGSLIATTLGVKNDPEAVLKALGNPDNVIKLKELDVAQQKANQDYELGLYQADASDRASAREREIALNGDLYNKITMLVLSATSLAALMLVIWMVVTQPLEQTARDILFMLSGGVLALVNQVYNYYFGSSHSSQGKSDLIDRLTTKK